MALTLSRQEIGRIYTLLRNTNDSLLETSPADGGSTESADNAFPKSVRLNKLMLPTYGKSFGAN